MFFGWMQDFSSNQKWPNFNFNQIHTVILLKYTCWNYIYEKVKKSCHLLRISWGGELWQEDFIKIPWFWTFLVWFGPQIRSKRYDLWNFNHDEYFQFQKLPFIAKSYVKTRKSCHLLKKIIALTLVVLVWTCANVLILWSRCRITTHFLTPYEMGKLSENLTFDESYFFIGMLSQQ